MSYASVLHVSPWFYIFLCPQAFLAAMMAPSCQGSKYQYLEETQVDGSMASKTDVKQAAWDPRGLLLNYYSRWKAAWQWEFACCQIGTSLKIYFIYQERNHNSEFHNLGIAKMCSEPGRLVWHEGQQASGMKSTPRHSTKADWISRVSSRVSTAFKRKPPLDSRIKGQPTTTKTHPKQGIQGAKPKVWRQIGIKPYKKNGLSVKHLPSSAWHIWFMTLQDSCYVVFDGHPVEMN